MLRSGRDDDLEVLLDSLVRLLEENHDQFAGPLEMKERGYVLLTEVVDGQRQFVGFEEVYNHSVTPKKNFTFRISDNQMWGRIGGILHTHTIRGDNKPSGMDMRTIPYREDEFTSGNMFIGVVYYAPLRKFHIYYRIGEHRTFVVSLNHKLPKFKWRNIFKKPVHEILPSPRKED